MKNARKFMLLIMIIVVAMTVAACGGDDDDGGDSSASNSPEEVVEDALESMFTGNFDNLSGLVCAEQQASLEASLGGGAGEELAAAMEGVTVDLSGLEYDADIDGDSGVVNVSGDVTTTIEMEGMDPIESVSPVTDMGEELTSAPVVLEDGEWKFCPESFE